MQPHPPPYPMQSYGDTDKPPKCLIPGIIVLTIGILEFIATIVVLAILLPGASMTTNSVVPGWWQFGLSFTLFTVTGSLAIASAGGKRNCYIAGIVFSGITLAWSLLNLALFVVALVAVENAIAALESEMQGFNGLFMAIEESSKDILTSTRIILIVALLVLVLLVACDISILILISKVTCCTRTRSVDRMGIVVQEAPPAVQAVHVYPYVQANVI